MTHRNVVYAALFLLGAAAAVTPISAGDQPERPRFMARKSGSIQPAAGRNTETAPTASDTAAEASSETVRTAAATEASASRRPSRQTAPRVTAPPAASKSRPAATGDASDANPLTQVLTKLQGSQQALDEIRDYTCLFTKREMIGRKLLTQSINLKFRRDPFSVYMLYDGAEKGREVLFVDGRMGNKVLVHEANVAVLGNVTIPLSLNAPEITRETRYPFTTVGLHKLTEVLTTELTRENGRKDISVEAFPGAKLTTPGTNQQRVCHAFRMTFPTPMKDRKFYQSVAYFDRETSILVRVENYAFPRREGEKPGLVEEYTYSKIEPNVGLSEQDFDPRNRAYHFQ